MSRSVQGDPGADSLEEPGDGVTCYHGEIALGTDPEPIFYPPCDQEAVLRVPKEGVVGPVALCPFHLARYLDAVDDDLEAELVSRGARDHAAEGFVAIDDAPPIYAEETDQGARVWNRAAIDQRGRAHYQRPDTGAVLRLDEDLDPELVELGDGGFPAYMEAVRADVGFAAFDPDLGLPTEIPGGEEA